VIRPGAGAAAGGSCCFLQHKCCSHCLTGSPAKCTAALKQVAYECCNLQAVTAPAGKPCYTHPLWHTLSDAMCAAQPSQPQQHMMFSRLGKYIHDISHLLRVASACASASMLAAATRTAQQQQERPSTQLLPQALGLTVPSPAPAALVQLVTASWPLWTCCVEHTLLCQCCSYGWTAIKAFCCLAEASSAALLRPSAASLCMPVTAGSTAHAP
jgi:hypothetical protein